MFGAPSIATPYLGEAIQAPSKGSGFKKKETNWLNCLNRGCEFGPVKAFAPFGHKRRITIFFAIEKKRKNFRPVP